MTLCEEIGAWAAGLAVEALPESVRERAALQRASIAAAVVAGRAAARPIAAVAPDGPLGEIYADAAASIAHDWDDYLFMGHTGHSAVTVSGAFAPDEPRRTVAQVAANEVAGRLGLALFVGPHNGQFWASIHCAAGAIAAGVGLGLDAQRMAHALAISLYQPPYGMWPGFMGPETKLLTAADPAVQGARAALLAEQGLDGPLDVLEDRRGVLTHLAFVRRPQAFTGLGTVWLTDTIAFKPRPGCAYLQSAVQAALDADVRAADVREVEIAGGALTVGMETLGARAGLRPVGVTFSTALSVAVALVAGRLTHAELEPAWLAAHEAELRSLAARTRLRHDWGLTAATVEGAARGGATLADVPARAWPRVVGRLRALHMDEALSPRDLRALGSQPRALRRLVDAGRSGRRGGTAGFDTAALRMTFPCVVRLRLAGGRVIEIEGTEPGACGHPLAEQRAVVEAKRATIAVQAS